MNESGITMGVDLGGTKTEALVIRRSGNGVSDYEELFRLRRPTARDEGYEFVVENTAALIRDAARGAGLSRLPPIGVGMPGSVTEQGLVKNSNTTCLNGRPFRADLATRVGAPIAFANDANCFALAETAFGAARGARVAFGVILGTGVGGGVVLAPGGSASGEARGVPTAWDGVQGVAGDWGHIALEPVTGDPCYCGRRGCVEQFLSGPAIERAYQRIAGRAAPLVGIAASYDVDADARRVLDDAMNMFGRGIAAVIGVLDPDVIVLGGGVSNVDLFYTAGIEAVRRWVFSDSLRTRIVKHAIGDSAGVLGAALLPTVPPPV